MCLEFNQINKKKSTTEILINTLVVENIGGLGVKTTRKEGKLGVKVVSKYMFPEFYQIQRKVQGDNIDYEN